MEKEYHLSKKSVDGSTIWLKTFELEELSIKEAADGSFIGEGYANTKNKPDSYGDIPTNFKNQPVYDLSRMKSNPVMLLDHQNSAGQILGKFIHLEEDSSGLFFKNQFRPLAQVHNPVVKDAISAFTNGFARALSIGGRWFFEDEENPKHLTKAVIHEISGVAVGADSSALFRSQPKPAKASNQDSKLTRREELEIRLKRLIAEYIKTSNPILLAEIKLIKQEVNNGIR